MKFSLYIVLLFLSVFSQKLSSLAINLNPNDEAQYGHYFSDKNNILSINPEEFTQKSEKIVKNTKNENFIDPSFKAVLQDISENSHFISSESKDEARFLSENSDYQRKIDETVGNQMSEISRESREEGLREKNQENAELYEFSHKNTEKSLLKSPRFLQKNEKNMKNEENTGVSYEPTELGMFLSQ